MVFVSAMVVQRKSTVEVIHRAKNAGKKVVAGGPIFLGEWQDFPEVDHFVLNEGEITLPQFLQDLKDRKAQHVYSTTEHADMATSPVPMWELVKRQNYDSLGIQFSRGCPFNCDFCNMTAMLVTAPAPNPRRRSSPSWIRCTAWDGEGIFSLWTITSSATAGN